MTYLKSCCIVVFLCFVGAVASRAQSAKYVYVATAGAEVYAVPVSGGTPTGLIPSRNTSGTYTYDSTAAFDSLAVGPDNTADNASANTYFFLYACDSTSGTIIRLQMSVADPGNAATAVDTVGNVSGAVCGRVDSEGDLYVSSKTTGDGVYVISGASSTPVGSSNFSAPAAVFSSSTGNAFTGGGITQKNNGDMLVVDTAGNEILHATFEGAASSSSDAPFASTLTSYVTGLDAPTAIARISTNDFFVLNQGNSPVERFDPLDLESPTACGVSLPNGNVTLSSLAASADNFVYVGIASTSPNKREVVVLDGTSNNCSSTGQTIDLSGVDAKYVAAVAVPPVPLSVSPTSAILPTTGLTSWTFNFGSSEVQTVTSGCEPVMEESQVPLPYLENLLTGLTGSDYDGGAINFTNGQPVPENGEGGFGTVYQVLNSSTCQPVSATDAPDNFTLGAFDDTTQFTNTRIVHCDGTSCTIPDTAGFWPIGGLLNGDITIGGSIPGFSRFFLANGQQPATSSPETGLFCGFESPLTDGPTYASFNSGQNLSVKFKVAQSGGNCSNGPYITDAIALLSVAKVSNTQGTGIIAPVMVYSSGNSTTVQPIFSFSPNNQQYEFGLSLNGYAPGTYALIVTFLSNTTVNGGATYVVTYFTVQ